jgi:hypothetical protein
MARNKKISAKDALVFIEKLEEKEQQKLYLLLAKHGKGYLGGKLRELIEMVNDWIDINNMNRDIRIAHLEVIESAHESIKRHRKPARTNINRKIVELDQQGMTESEVHAEFEKDGIKLSPAQSGMHCIVIAKAGLLFSERVLPSKKYSLANGRFILLFS